MRPHPDRLLGIDASVRSLARELYDSVADAPIISPHGHVSAELLATNAPFPDPAALLVTPDHYVTRLLHSAGVPLEALGVGGSAEAEPRAIWRTLCENWHLFAGTPVRYWFEDSLSAGVRARADAPARTTPTRSTTTWPRDWPAPTSARASC